MYLARLDAWVYASTVCSSAAIEIASILAAAAAVACASALAASASAIVVFALFAFSALSISQISFTLLSIFTQVAASFGMPLFVTGVVSCSSGGDSCWWLMHCA